MNDVIDKLELFLDSKRIPITDYRQSLYSKVVFDKYHKQTSKGHVIVVKQFRKDFYKPKGFIQEQEDFFGLQQTLRNLRMQATVDNADEVIKNFFTQIKELFEEGFVLHHWEIKEIRALQFVGDPELEFINELKVKDIPLLPGHIRAIRHGEAQYEGHKPLETSSGKKFYYRTGWSPKFKPDMDFTQNINSPKFEYDEVIKQGDITVVSNPNEEPLIIQEMNH